MMNLDARVLGLLAFAALLCAWWIWKPAVPNGLDPAFTAIMDKTGEELVLAKKQRESRLQGVNTTAP